MSASRNTPNDVEVLWNGGRVSLRAFCERFGVKYDVTFRVIRRARDVGQSDEWALDRRVNFERSEQSLRVLCERFDVFYPAVCGRLGKGVDIEAALQGKSSLVGRTYGEYTILSVTRSPMPCGADRVIAHCRCSCGSLRDIGVVHLQDVERPTHCGCLKLKTRGLPTTATVFGESVSIVELARLAGVRAIVVAEKMRNGAVPEAFLRGIK